ncbi:15992_t:CDS:1 [Cetraspora pellucida]|uniref:15992_t:CDS:1 n=1 Tax=Cetraspora pellucida TaxID=1433469 RepID=A0ACA9NG38_9GLOM|nr:15992_t:CDS:1 [Cetraspora pellucida]
MNPEYAYDIKETSNIEYTSDIEQSFDTERSFDIERTSDEYVTTVKKYVEESTSEPSTKKIRVSFNQSNKPRKKSYVWLYFEEEKEYDICKIIVTIKNIKKICERKYKHDGSTRNMKLHLRLEHKIFAPNELGSNLDEKCQLNIAEMFKKVVLYKEFKQLDLKHVTAEWLVTDSLLFNIVYGKGY